MRSNFWATLNRVSGHTNNTDSAVEMVKRVQAEFTAAHLSLVASGEAERVLHRFALVAAAGELAVHAKVLPWPEGEAIRAAGICFKDWLRARGGSGPGDDAAAIDQVRKYIEQHGDSRFALVEEREREGTTTTYVQPVSNRAGFRWEEDDRMAYFFLKEVFKDDACAGYDHKTVAEALITKGYLVRNEAGRQTYKTRAIEGYGRLRGYLVKSSILED